MGRIRCTTPLKEECWRMVPVYEALTGKETAHAATRGQNPSQTTMIHSFLRKLVIWPLMALMAGLPLPWVHRHSDLPTEKLATHLARLHADDCMVSPNSWHVHVIGISVPPEEGVNQAEDFSSASCSTMPYAIEDSSINEFDRGTIIGQHAAYSLSESPIATSAYGVIGGSLQLVTSRRLQQLLCSWQI